jgi:hypothetical protein
MSNSLYVEVNNPTRYHYREQKEWGRWKEHNTFEGCRVYVSDFSKDNASYRSSTDVDFEVTTGMIVYPVFVIYGTGDSFGHSTGNVQLVDVFDDAQKARGLEDAIRKATYENYKYTFEYAGKKYYAGSWTGYFERLEDVVVETEVVRA